MKRDTTMTGGGPKCFKLSIVVLLLNFVAPVTGFTLRYCRISYNNAICDKSNLKDVPGDIPLTVSGIDLSSNRISKIRESDFKHRSLLTQLDLKRNNILQVDTGAFADLISLKTFNLNNNRLVELGDDLFEGLSNLTDLRISSNRLQVVASTAFKSLRSLRFLDISHNKLQHLSKVGVILQHLPNLRDLVITNNDITTFRSSELTNGSLGLTSLDLSQNPITVFSITADIFPNLSRFIIGSSLRKKKQMQWDVQSPTFLSRVSTLDIGGLQMACDDMKRLLERVNSSLTSLRMNAMKKDLPQLIGFSCLVTTVSTLQLRRNNPSSVSELFRLCVNVTEIDLAENRIQNIRDEDFRSIQGLRVLSLSRNRLLSVPTAMRNMPTLTKLDLSRNNISTLGCHDFANLTNLRHLSLYLNSISTLEDCVFKDLVRLQVLKLQHNRIYALNGAFRRSLPNLTQLRLNSNKLKVITHSQFNGLTSLQNLSLHENQITTLAHGAFKGLTNLTDIQLQSNALGYKEMGSLNDLINLRRLDMSDNHIKYDNDSALPHPPFSQLSRLETLAMPGQHRRGKSQLPRNFLQGLTSLLTFRTRNIQLLSLHKDMFNDTTQLEELDISSNDLVDLSPDLFSPIQGLKSLYLSRTTLRSLDFLTEVNLTHLEFLQARKNAYSVISEEVIESLPALVYVDLQGNSFTCDCDNAWFLQWAQKNNQTQVFDAYNFECNYPQDLKGMKLLDLDVQSCSVNTDFICFVSTTCTILLLMVASFTYHFLRLQLVYAYYLVLTLLFDSKRNNKQAPPQYDAFISYNAHDEPWVVRQLLPKLEGEQGWRLCLHHRDFEPGKPIMDNITDAIYGSRKTICVISRRYLESEWCSREIQVASFRLFDEQKDVLILVFLEEIPASQMSPYYRMKKLLKSRTYLSWPRAAGHTELFWEKLRQALKTKEDLGDERLPLTAVDRH